MKVLNRFILYYMLAIFTLVAILFLAPPLQNTTASVAPVATNFSLPLHLPEVDDNEDPIRLRTENGTEKELTLIPYIQKRLDKYIASRGSPVAAVVLADAKTGAILAMSQGMDPEKWGSSSHTALHTHFPAASLFKTVIAGAALEVAKIDPLQPFGLRSGCGDVHPTGVWLSDKLSTGRYGNMTLRRAYGLSCNGFFAKLAVNYLGLSTVTDFAYRFGWDGNIGTDFKVDPSPMTAPSVENSSIHSIGRYAAGFGYVGISAVHAAWIMMAMANQGLAKDLYIFKDSLDHVNDDSAVTRSILSPKATEQLVGMMDATINGGTASFAFKRGKYKKLRPIVGGKTGTLSGKSPKGIATWFTGMMPLDNPEVIVSTIVVLEDLWHIKGPNLAAEAFALYEDYKKQLNIAKKTTPNQDSDT